MNTHDIKDEKILSQEENKISLEFTIPETSDFFDGHFPEIITRFSRKYFKTQRYVPSIKRIKFSAPIRPNSKIQLDLTNNLSKGTVSFNMADFSDASHVYSSGSFSVIPE